VARGIGEQGQQALQHDAPARPDVDDAWSGAESLHDACEHDLGVTEAEAVVVVSEAVEPRGIRHMEAGSGLLRWRALSRPSISIMWRGP
jgi:hypothetical protein